MAELICDSGEIPLQTVAECGSEASGIIAVAFIEPEVDTDTTPTAIATEAFWTTALAADPALVHIIKETRGEKPASEAVKGEGVGKVKERVIGRNHSASFEFEGILANRNLVNTLNYRTNLRFVMITNGGLMYYTDAPVSIDGDLENPREIDGMAFYRVNVTWTKNALVKVYEAPEGIFD